MRKPIILVKYASSYVIQGVKKIKVIFLAIGSYISKFLVAPI